MAFLDYLLQKGVIKSKEIETIRSESDENGETPESVLMRRGMERDQLLKLKSEYFSVPFKSVEPSKVPLDVMKLIPEESAKHYKFVPVGVEEGILQVGMVEPDNIDAKDALQFISAKVEMPYKIFLIGEDDFNAVFENYKTLSGEVTKALSDLEIEGAPEERAVKEEPEKAKPGVTIVEEAPITKIVAVILKHAVEGGASDIHIEPTEEKVQVRFRVGGLLQTSLLLPRDVLNAVVARIKVLAGLRLDEKRKPQDGSFSARIEKRKIDFRVSTLPTYYGEKVVMRILDPGMGIKKLEETGLTKRGIEMIRSALHLPFGLILLTGPTGSGKTTTLYAMLNELNREVDNVVSLEDPVEYLIKGVSQSQVRPEIGYTFATGLRSIFRQDPDIILVGEIRDKETATLAIQAALTGHLVLSTIHTNNAAGVVPRLVDMGIDPYLIAPTLVLAVAQRLVPVLCEEKKAIPVEGAMKEMIDRQFAEIPAEFRKDLPKPTQVYEAEPSSTCPSGTRGRVGVYEMFAVDKEMERVILENPVEEEILKVARKKGMLAMKDDALVKAIEGKISFLEVNRFE
ncbi:MAG: Flp pilus assembly complex ATPase component TadA [Parcubacteria group bacterium]|nr:Flp pilus assembly complex ATPase component TadA [Parcubacteria group bacterium]